MDRLSGIAALLLIGCDRGGDKGSSEVDPEATVCAAPALSSSPALGDANLDGAVDVSDGVATLRALLNAREGPACAAASDLIQDGTLDLSDGFAVWYHLFAGNTALPKEIDGDCSTLEALPDVACGALSVSFDTPETAAEAFEARVLIRSPALEIEAWSLGVSATGCTVTAAVASGVSEDRRRSAGGLRDVGYERTELVEGGAVSAVVLSWREERSIPPSSDPAEVLTLHVSATPPATGCGSCVLSIVHGLTGSGEPVASVLTHEGRSYSPERTEATVMICGDGD